MKCSAKSVRPTGLATKSAAALVAALIVTTCLAAPLTGCGGDDGGGGNGGGGSSPELVSIEEALASEEGRAVKVQGHVVATDSGVVLASALLESYPPQAGGATLPVVGLDLAAVAGLDSTAQQGDLATVIWSDFPVRLQGVIKSGALAVEQAPRTVEAATADLRVRFCLPVEPLKSGETTWWVFDATNLTSSSLDVTFASGQMGDVVLSQDGVEKYRWSEGKAFTEAIRVDTIEAGATKAYVFNDILQVAAGEYDLTATVTAAAGVDGGAGDPLPGISTTVTVR